MTIQFSRQGMGARPDTCKSDQAWYVDLFKPKTIPGSNAYGRGSESLMMSSSQASALHLRTFTSCATEFPGILPKPVRDGADHVREK